MEQRPEIPSILFHTLHRAQHNLVQSMLAQRGLEDLGSPMVLFFVQDRAAAGTLPAQREIAQGLNVSPAAVGNSLKSLERAGYVERQPDPSDQRCKRIAITEKGERALKDCVEVMAYTDQQMFAGFTAEEQEQLTRFHCRMLDNLMSSDRECWDTLMERMDREC